MGDEEHAVLKCPSFSPQREKLLKYLEKLFPNFSMLNDTNRLYFMLTSENQCVNAVSKFLNIIYSSQRPNFAKTWRRISGSL